MISHLEHHRPDKNCFRFYRMDIARDLFGTWTLRCSWGRIGTHGRDRLESFSDRAQAEAAQAVLLAQKRRKGYVLLPEQFELPFDLVTDP